MPDLRRARGEPRDHRRGLTRVLIAVALGLGAALSWGFSDFLGGIQARRIRVLALLLVSQGTGLVAIAIVVAAGAGEMPSGEALAFASGSAIAGLVGLASFYRGLAIGAMAVVAPISATAAVIPVTVGVATGERPSALQGAGVAIALIGVVLASREPGAERGSGIAAGVPLAALSALGFGTFFLLMDRASDEDVVYSILANRVTTVTLLVVLALAIRPKLPERSVLPLLGLIGMLDITANALFAIAATQGLVSVAAVLASLYPVVVIVLARVVLHERVARVQQAGAAGALAGVVLISAG